MADTAAHRDGHVFPHVPVRQWVFTVPFRLRFRMAFDRNATATVRRILLRRILAFYRRRAARRRGQDAASGAVCFLQRFGSALNLNPHFHILLLDGAFAAPAASWSTDSAARFATARRRSGLPRTSSSRNSRRSSHRHVPTW